MEAIEKEITIEDAMISNKTKDEIVNGPFNEKIVSEDFYSFLQNS